MSLLEKAIIPLIGINVTKQDFNNDCGFIDSYTDDPDHPNCYKEILLAFNDKVRNDKSIDLAKRLTYSPNLKRCYVKYANDIPYMIYVMYVPHNLQKYYNGSICLSAEERIKVAKFWGIEDADAIKLMCNTSVYVDAKHSVPLEEYISSDEIGLVINKEGK